MVTNTQNSWIGEAIKNKPSAVTDLCPCKRKFSEFATQLAREYYKSPQGPKEQTVGELIAAGSDLANILSSACQLTNDLHPIFRDENLCFCEYAHSYHCIAPRFANNPEWISKIPQKALFQKDKFIVRTILQLASQMITQPQTLPFWAGLMDAVVLDGETDLAAFKVHPTRLLDPARQACVLEALERFALDMRVHFKDFVHDGNVTPKVQGYCSIEYVRDMDPDYRRGVNQHYAYRNGRATIESGSRPFIHMFINLSKSGCLRDYDVLRHMTITEMKVDMFSVASTICHEFSHALEQHYCDSGGMPLLNDEIMIETGLSLESFLFGGLYSRHNRKGEQKPSLQRWPSPAMYEHYMKYNHPMETRPSMDLGPERCFPIEPRKIAVFLEQSFWDDPEPPVGCWKKMWLRPYCEVALDREDFDYFNSGSQIHSGLVRRSADDLAMRS